MEENTSILNKKVSDLTVGENMKVTIGANVAAAVAVTLVPLVVAGVSYVAKSGYAALKNKKQAKLSVENDES